MQVPQDDVLDVMEMSRRLENYILKVFKGNDGNLAMSALMTATINSVLSQCKTINDALFYKSIFIKIFEDAIRDIKLRQQ